MYRALWHAESTERREQLAEQARRWRSCMYVPPPQPSPAQPTPPPPNTYTPCTSHALRLRCTCMSPITDMVVVERFKGPNDTWRGRCMCLRRRPTSHSRASVVGCSGCACHRVTATPGNPGRMPGTHQRLPQWQRPGLLPSILIVMFLPPRMPDAAGAICRGDA